MYKLDKRFNKVVIWGFTLDTNHTQAYTQYGFYKAFKYMGYDTYWLKDEKIDNIDFSNTLFIAQKFEQQNIPLVKDSYYVLHDVDERQKYIDSGCKLLLFQVYTNQFYQYKKKDDIEFNNHTYLLKGEPGILFTTWATDLLPNEINLNDAKNITDKKECLWIGTYWDSDSKFQNRTELDPYFNLCEENGITVKKYDPWGNSKTTFEENRTLINNAYLAPTIAGMWQVEVGYVPCRIYKNISYGHMGYTNSEQINNIFNNELIYDRNTTNLFYKSIEFKNNPNHIEKLKYLMNEVKENHTFVNRAKYILESLPE